MAMLSGYAVGMASLPFLDHTYVASDDGFAWGCFGRDAGGVTLGSTQGDSKFANCLSDPKVIGVLPSLYAGLRYLRTGVCHQAANRILYLTGMSVASASGYRWSVARFSWYGKGPWPELAKCATLHVWPSANPPHGGPGSRMKSDKDTHFAASVQGLYRPDTFATLGDQPARLRLKRKELEAMATTYLGENYDRAKIEAIIAIQLKADVEQDRLLEELESNEVSAEGYLNRLENLFAATATACERTIGSEDFERLFGIRSKDATGLVDREHFLGRR
jgi:hypothetical protein